MNKKFYLAICTVMALSILIAITACGQQGGESGEGDIVKNGNTIVSDADVPSRDTVVPAEDWKDQYPKQYESYMANLEQEYDYTGAPNEMQQNYLENYPQLKTLWAPSAYSREYTHPHGHPSSKHTVENTIRDPGFASCYNCKSPDYIIQYEKDGGDFTSLPFEEATPLIENPISCYDCHENQPGLIKVNRPNLVNAIDDYNLEIDDRLAVCGQCHNDYGFTEDTHEAYNPFKYGLGPDEALKHYNEIGYVDFEQEQSGIPMLKSQHPELETFIGSIHESQGLACPDCHMAPEDGYSSHQWTSPFRNETTMNEVCLGCHTTETVESIEQRVEDIQAEIREDFRRIGDMYVDAHYRIGENRDAISDADYEKLSQLIRDGQFYWDWVFTENSDGYHNSGQSRECMKKAEAMVTEANEILDAAGIPEAQNSPTGA